MGMRIVFALLCSCLAACAAPACRYTIEDAKTMTQDPAQLHAYFMDQIRCGQYGNAYEHCFSKTARESLGPYESSPFYFVIQFELVKRMIVGLEQHDVRVDEGARTATVRWCNREFGLSREYRLVEERVGRTKKFWKYDFTRQQLEELKDAAFAWFRRQKEVADGRLYSYPPDWQYSPLGGACTCKR